MSVFTCQRKMVAELPDVEMKNVDSPAAAGTEVEAVKADPDTLTIEGYIRPPPREILRSLSRLNEFFHDLLSFNPSYKELWKAVRLLLVLCHGQATVERGFSVNRQISVENLKDIKEHARHIEKAVTSKEPRFILRILRALMPTRKRLNDRVLRKIVTGFFTHSSQDKDALLGCLEEPMETDGAVKESRIRSAKTSHLPLLPELDVYIHLLVLVYLIDAQRYEKAVQCSDQLMQKIQAQNRRTLDLLASKCYFYHSRCYELTDRMSDIRSIHRVPSCFVLRFSSSGFAVYSDGTDCSFVFVRAFERTANRELPSVDELPFADVAFDDLRAAGVSIPARITFEGFADADKDLELCAELTDDEIIRQVTEDSDDSDTENEEPALTQPTSSELTRALMTLSSVYSGNMTLTEIEADMIAGKRTVQKKISDFFAPKC
ncbi:hypothetical protein HPB49_006475 [Dermacentor silvarum]|uniref:Uncharacterized protein n=1 Tax=Dermacentor silvarum TaxID=543639 RepID=A0ACB8CJS3_DERSI|nr:hypothetical protein HPB49_006475 [Dermacentor silvarum]